VKTTEDYKKHGVIDRAHARSDVTQKMLLTVPERTAIHSNCG